MSKSTLVYEALVTSLGTLFPAKLRIPNAYDLTQNPKQFLSDGFGIKVGTTEKQVLEFDSMTVSRSFSVVLAREVFKKDTDFEIVDDATKLILEDVYSVQNLLYSSNELGIPDDILMIDLGEVSGISSVNTDKQNSLTIEIACVIWFKENL